MFMVDLVVWTKHHKALKPTAQKVPPPPPTPGLEGLMVKAAAEWIDR
jgi:hypothetical protein